MIYEFQRKLPVPYRLRASQRHEGTVRGDISHPETSFPTFPHSPPQDSTPEIPLSSGIVNSPRGNAGSGIRFKKQGAVAREASVGARKAAISDWPRLKLESKPR